MESFRMLDVDFQEWGMQKYERAVADATGGRP
jgi:hypothetical protein